MSSSAICQNFVQNAWKKELCSNCFKSKDEHLSSKPKPKSVQLISSDEVIGIIKNDTRSKPKLSVCFLKDLTEVIGYGGDDWQSDNEDEVQDDDESSDCGTSTDSEGEETHKELKRITKENTDFNTTNLGEVEPKRSFAQLLLGKPLTDASGKKQTLLVSVTPFGEEPSSPSKKCGVKAFSHIPIAAKNKQMVAESKSNNVVLTSYTKNEDKEEKSLLDEINETLENGRNPISIVSKKKTEKEIVLSVNEMEMDKEKDKNDDEIEEERVRKIVVTEKKINLTRTPALKRDVEKPVVYQTSTASIELMNTKNLKLNKDTNNNKAKSEVNNNNTSDDEKTSKEKKDEINSNVVEKGGKDEDENTTVTGLPPPVPVKGHLLFAQSREQAGKPDGREDPSTSSGELPPLPVTPPPPLEPQSSFLHGPAPVVSPPPIYEKPKIPAKPATMLARKPPVNVPPPPAVSEPPQKPPLAKQDSNELDGRKRKAPMPPEDSVYSKTGSDSAVSSVQYTIEENGKERASSCAPKLTVSSDEVDYVAPKPAARKSLSISTDCLASDEKRKQKARFSLKKFLRMSSNKDISKISSEEVTKPEEKSDGSHSSKPRLVIVHPSELNGSKVEVVASPTGVAPNAPLAPPNHNNGWDPSVVAKPATVKPPPPPRNFDAGATSGIRPPPKSTEILNRQRQTNRNEITRKANAVETVYANIGEVRSAIVPNKPVRTASMREREAMMQQKQQMRQKHHNYEAINVRSKESSENVYDYISSTRSSSPESDSSPKTVKKKTVRLGKRSESSIDVSGEYFRYCNNIPRSVSLTYCGSETESEIYSPYGGFYGSESEVTEDDHDWIQNGGKTHKLRSRKGRSIVHKNLEDNYGAVVVANHEALAQVLENIHPAWQQQPALRGLKNAASLRWSDFTLVCPAVTANRRAFHPALWSAQHHRITLCTEPAAGAGALGTAKGALALGSFAIGAITEFADLVPEKYLAGGKGEALVQATVSVLPWLQIHTVQSYSEFLKSKSQNHEHMWKDSNFILLQLVNALKTLQAQGIEELPVSLSCFVLCKEMEKDNHYRLCVLQGLTDDDTEQHGTLCACALRALHLLQPTPRIASLLQSLLSLERAVSLTQVKSVLEFTLWGPSDVQLGSTVRERELALQRWLDLQRATVLHGLVCARVQLTVYEECHLTFLVRSNAKMMCDASLLIESSNVKQYSITNGHK